MEQLVILLIIGLISLINWIVQKSAEIREKRKLERQAQYGEESLHTPLPENKPRVFKKSQQQDPMRQLREALGLPSEESETLEPEQHFEPPPLLKPQLPPPPSVPALIQKVVRAIPTAPMVSEEGPDTPSLHTWSQKLEIVEPSRSEHSRIRQLLASRSGLRDAVILSEILGSPRGLRAFAE